MASWLYKNVHFQRGIPKYLKVKYIFYQQQKEKERLKRCKIFDSSKTQLLSKCEFIILFFYLQCMFEIFPLQNLFLSRYVEFEPVIFKQYLLPVSLQLIVLELLDGGIRWGIILLIDTRSCCCCCVASVVSNFVRPHRRQPTRLPVPGILQARTLEWVAISSSNA